MLANADARFDRAVWATYGWNDPDPATEADATVLARVLVLSLDHSAP